MSILIGLLFGDSEALISELCYVRQQLDFWKLANACLLFSAPGMKKSSARNLQLLTNIYSLF